MFTSQPKLVMNSGVHSSLHPNCHYQIVFSKFNHTVFYPPPDNRLPWNYEQVNTDLKRAIELFDWEKSFSNLKVNKQVSVFNEAVMNTFENFIKHKTITCNSKDPHWMNKQIKTLIAEKSSLYKRLKQKMVNSKVLDKLHALQAKLQGLSNFFQYKCYMKISKKLSDSPSPNAIGIY